MMKPPIVARPEAPLQNWGIETRLLPVSAQQIPWKPFSGMEVEFMDDEEGVVGDVVFFPDRIIGLIAIPPGFRTVIYFHKKH